MCWVFVVYASGSGSWIFSARKSDNISNKLTKENWDSLMDALDANVLPDWTIMAFNLSECPAWRSKYSIANEWRFLMWSNSDIWSYSWYDSPIMLDTSVNYGWAYKVNSYVKVLYCIKWVVGPADQYTVTFITEGADGWRRSQNAITASRGSTITKGDNYVSIWTKTSTLSDMDNRKFMNYTTTCPEGNLVKNCSFTAKYVPYGVCKFTTQFYWSNNQNTTEGQEACQNSMWCWWPSLGICTASNRQAIKNVTFPGGVEKTYREVTCSCYG